MYKIVKVVLCHLQLLFFISKGRCESLDGDFICLQFSFGFVKCLLVLLLQSILSLPNLTAQLLQLIVQILQGKVIQLNIREQNSFGRYMSCFIGNKTYQNCCLLSHIEGLVSFLLLLLHILKVHL